MNGFLCVHGILILLCSEAILAMSLPATNSFEEMKKGHSSLPVSVESKTRLTSKEHSHKTCASLQEYLHNQKSASIRRRYPRKLSNPYSVTSPLLKANPQSDSERLPAVTISGHSVHLECVPNAKDRQEPPCILQSSGAVVKADLAYSRLPQYHNELKLRYLQDLLFESGEFAYLPCRTLGAGEEDTTIWEKGDNPLFASKTKFSKSDRIHLVTNENTMSQADGRMPDKVFRIEGNRTHYLSEKRQNLKKDDQISQWDLVINFLQPSDSDVYTCRLVGRTQQLIRYRVNVKELKPLTIYSTKPLVQMNVPQSVNMGYQFNLTCSVQLSQTNSAYITVDWFRPDHSYEGLHHSVSTSSNVTVSLGSFPSLSKVQSTLVQNKAADAISWFAQSFTQVVNQPNFGNILYKQLRIEKDFTYRSEAIFTVQKATLFEEGFYECRAYEPVNFGHERVLDRAITAVVVNRPYPQKPSEDGKWFRQFGYLLAGHWNLLSESDQRQHDQQAQNDGGIKVMTWMYPGPRLKSSQRPSSLESNEATSSFVREKVSSGAKRTNSVDHPLESVLFFAISKATLYFFIR
ncbi:hypothetical protein D915_002787 [Fasciola hepatica]|uniref:Ig-like domain-containing protein n=1 Tax=Fasciola hepatica TaxID=6192 RepID=A0A4E0S1B0_FASHE|nr:hypothetical protein D915_002787 [Fasciola hepatica]